MIRTAKRLVITICLFLLCGFAYSQSGYVYTQELNSSYASRSIYVCSDNSVVVLGNSDDLEEFNFMSIAITKLNPQGNLLWRRHLYPGGYQYISITGVDIDNEDKVTFIITLFGGTLIQLGSIDSSGVISFISEVIEIPMMGITFNKALRTPNNEIVVVGKASQNYDVSSACYFRFSAMGDTLATAFWPVDQGSQYLEAEAYDLAPMDNGNVLVACSLRSDINSILEVSSGGVILSRYNIPGQDQFFGFPICREPNSQTYLVAYQMGEYPNNSIFVDRFNNGTFEHLFNIPDNVLRDPHSMILVPNGIYICGMITGSGSLVSLSLNGDVNWIWNQQDSNTCEYIAAGFGSISTALLGLDDAGCVYWAWGNSGQQVIIKLLPNGQVPVEDEVQTPELNVLSAYPNPMTDVLNISMKGQSNNFGERTQIGIYNIRGQLVRSIVLGNSNRESKVVWDGKDEAGFECSSGIYILRVIGSRGSVMRVCKTNRE